MGPEIKDRFNLKDFYYQNKNYLWVDFELK